MVDLAERFTQRHLEITPDRQVITQLLQLVSEAKRLASYLINTVQPKRLLLATQHEVLARATSVVARRQQIPSVYIPHAPTADNAQYRDLPFNLALLRGEADRSAYVAWGAQAERLDVIGDVSWQCTVVKPEDQLPQKIVVAPSPWPRPQLEWFFDCIREGIDHEYVVLPHPGNDPKAIRRLASKNATVLAEIRSVDYLARNPSVVITGGSGIGLEALALGNGLIDLMPEGRQTNYLFQRTSLVSFASNAEELADAIRRELTHRLPSFDALGYSKRWLAATGLSAVSDAWRAINSVIDVTDWALDAWEQPVLEMEP